MQNPEHQYFIVQEMVNNVSQSGVVFAKNEINGIPCVKINFSNQNETSSITSGKKNGSIIYYIYQNKNKLLNNINLYKINNVIKTLLKFFNPLDLEFCIDKKNKLYLLQIRKLNLPKNLFKKEKYIISLKNFEKKLKKLLNIPLPTMHGEIYNFLNDA
jgi:phosphoenolpyruvate synthase/pyruvate phosphate dikinase